jgi:dienelactone hydrolase
MNGTNLSSLNISQKRINQLLNDTQKVISSTAEFYQNLIIVKSAFGPASELPWNDSSKSSYYICFTKTKELRPIKENCIFPINQIALSPDQKYLLYFDPEQKGYISYNVETQKSENLSKGISETFISYSPIDRSQLIPEDKPDAIPDLYWIEGTHSVIVHGTFDLWQLDLENKTAPINLTEGKGNKEKIIFSLLVPQFGYLKSGEIYLMTGQNVKTQAFGLYKLTIGKKDFHQVLNDQNAFDLPYGSFSSIFKKANKANAYLLTLGNAATSQNFFYTTGFRKIIPISNNYPEKKYNWFTTELINYKDNKGNFCEGVLYRPENFNPQKKYPVIFYYYLDMTTQFNRFKEPNPSYVGVNIPLLVSDGYIVCTPNIYRMKGAPGEAALVSVSAAVDYLSNFTWIDTSKMGVSGHSLGGFETDYIVAHSTWFKAAMSAAGASSMVDSYNETFLGEGFSKQAYVKKNALVMGGGLDEIPKVYIENSPIFDAKSIYTPMLLMHNDDDKNVSVEHSKKLFIQLRSLQKPVWWVQYKGEEHMLLKYKNRIDFQEKVKGFFDVYLKGSTPPNWMLKAIKPVF